ncbi:hypothetical protein HZA33_00700 [Candidatus Pacearchaeota archaeon]|nr:hypothetical protein [Candidatus Pacearchaeota archaeon]
MSRQTCPNKKENEKDCPCYDTSCSRHGICCECIAYHRKTRSRPACI